MKILVADDDESSRSFMETILKKAGYLPIIVQNGVEAWEILNKQPVRMVITDWVMPQMDGLELCRKIREAALKNYVYIMLLTAKGHSSDAVKGLEAGADDFITKPFSPSELLARLRSGKRIIQLEDDHKNANFQLLQSEKMASIGQLAAGVAHEINNPTGFVSSNLKTLTEYNRDLFKLYGLYQSLIAELQNNSQTLPKPVLDLLNSVKNFEAEIDIDYLRTDIIDLVKDCGEGAERIKKIVIDLKDFAHPGEDKLKPANINDGIESTLNVISNEIKYKATVHKNFGELPTVQCYPQQLNQVFLNIIVNAAQAIETKGDITISTRSLEKQVEIVIEDNGSGIPPENLARIFDPFFTTKAVGKGTGLGMNVAYNIIQKHKGTIRVESELGKGTRFTIVIPTQEDEQSNE
ncbi:MAG: response regulator [Proteobacteria bacterium]|nr:response regulator [Pseudomonadota bacterium]